MKNNNHDFNWRNPKNENGYLYEGYESTEPVESKAQVDNQRPTVLPPEGSYSKDMLLQAINKVKQNRLDSLKRRYFSDYLDNISDYGIVSGYTKTHDEHNKKRATINNTSIPIGNIAVDTYLQLNALDKSFTKQKVIDQLVNNLKDGEDLKAFQTALAKAGYYSSRSTTIPANTKADIKALQQKLIAYGYDLKNGADGIINKETIKQWEQYSRDHNISNHEYYASGKVEPATKKAATAYYKKLFDAYVPDRKKPYYTMAHAVEPSTPKTIGDGLLDAWNAAKWGAIKLNTLSKTNLIALRDLLKNDNFHFKDFLKEMLDKQKSENDIKNATKDNKLSYIMQPNPHRISDITNPYMSEEYKNHFDPILKDKDGNHLLLVDMNANPSRDMLTRIVRQLPGNMSFDGVLAADAPTKFQGSSYGDLYRRHYADLAKRVDTSALTPGEMTNIINGSGWIPASLYAPARGTLGNISYRALPEGLEISDRYQFSLPKNVGNPGSFFSYGTLRKIFSDAFRAKNKTSQRYIIPWDVYEQIKNNDIYDGYDKNKTYIQGLMDKHFLNELDDVRNQKLNNELDVR